MTNRDIEFFRVKEKASGYEKSIPAATFSDLWTRLDQPAVDDNGDPLPDKPKTTVSAEAAKKKAGQKAVPKKEHS